MKKAVYFFMLMIGIFLMYGCTDVEEIPEPGDENPTVTIYHDVELNFDNTDDNLVIQVESGQRLDEPEIPIKEGYNFLGWYTSEDFDEESVFDFEQPISEDMMLYAKWEETIVEISESEKIEMDILPFSDFHQMEVTTSSIDLATKGDNGTTFTWSSSDETALTNKGVVIPNPIGGTDKAVTLTLKAKNGDTQSIIEYDLIIPAKNESTITSFVELPYETLTEEYEVLDGSLLTYYVDNGSVPYVDIEDMITLLQGYIHSEDIEFLWNQESQILTLSYSTTYVDEITQEEVTDDYVAYLDFTLNTITVPNLSFFDGYIFSTATDYSAGLTYLEDYYYEEGDTIIFDLNAYRFDMLYENGDYIMPFHLANLLFCGGSYFNVYYNGDGYKGIYTFGDDPTEFMTSSLNDSTIPVDVRLATFDAFAFTLDYFYGLKVEAGIESYYTELNQFIEDMLSPYTLYSSRAYSDFVYKVLDELHSSMIYGSFYDNANGDTPSISLFNLGDRTKAWYDVYFSVQDQISSAWGSEENIPDYRIIDGSNTAIIYLDGFVTKQVDDPDTVIDSDVFMETTLQSIFLENSNIENIVIDISYNTGGNLGALYRVLGYITENPIASHYQNPISNEKSTYWLEVDTTARTEINWFLMTSKVTFSAANLMAAIGKYQDVATIIGTTSGGGACSILPIYLPDGSGYQISSLNMISYRIGSEAEGWEYIGIESGVTPDYELSVNRLTNDAFIVELIEKINNGTATPYES
ncbi:MAG: S41 family peptidase [Acholeplasmataceae bacterium]|nr:S41 family peptidase [Acholeplasmataceae bacterium]